MTMACIQVPGPFVEAVHVDALHRPIVVDALGPAARLIDPQPTVDEDTGQGAQQTDETQPAHPIHPIVAGQVDAQGRGGRDIAQHAVGVRRQGAGEGHAVHTGELGRHIARLIGHYLEGAAHAGVLDVAGAAFFGGEGAVGDIVVDAVGLDLSLDLGVVQAQGDQFTLDQGDFGLGVQAQFDFGQLSIAVTIEHGQDLGSIRLPGAVIRQIDLAQILHPNGADWVAIGPKVGGDQVEGGKLGVAVGIRAGHQDGFEAGDEGGHLVHLAFEAAVGDEAGAVGVDGGPVHLLQGRGVEFGDVAAFAAEAGEVQFGVGQPIVGGLGHVAGFAAAHGVGVFRGHQTLGRFAPGEVVVRLDQVVAEVHAPGVKGQMLRAGVHRLLVVDGVVDREVTVGALHVALGVDVVGAGQFILVRHIEPSVLDTLAGEDLARALGVPVVRADVAGDKGGGVGVDRAVAGAAVPGVGFWMPT